MFTLGIFLLMKIKGEKEDKKRRKPFEKWKCFFLYRKISDFLALIAPLFRTVPVIPHFPSFFPLPPSDLSLYILSTVVFYPLLTLVLPFPDSPYFFCLPWTPTQPSFQTRPSFTHILRAAFISGRACSMDLPRESLCSPRTRSVKVLRVSTSLPFPLCGQSLSFRTAFRISGLPNKTELTVRKLSWNKQTHLKKSKKF